MKVSQIVAEHQKGAALGLLYLLCFSMIAVFNPIAGWLSDKIYTRWGRRKPFLVVGTLIFASSNVALAFSNTYLFLLLSLLITSIGYAINIYVSVIPEIGNAEQRGL